MSTAGNKRFGGFVKKIPRMFFGQLSTQKLLQKKEVVDTVRAKRFSERILCQKTIRTLPLNGT